MNIAILTTDELRALSARSNFQEAGRVRLVTSDVKPIDTALIHPEDFFRQAREMGGAFPTLDYRSTLIIPPPPERLLHIFPENKRFEHLEPVSFDVRGATVDSTFHILHFTDPKGRSHLFGLGLQGSRLIHSRTIDLAHALAFISIDPRSILASSEALDIAVHVDRAPTGPGFPRL